MLLLLFVLRKSRRCPWLNSGGSRERPRPPSLLWMPSPLISGFVSGTASGWSLAAVGSKMACEAHPNPEDSPTHETWVCGSCSSGGDWLALLKARFLCAFAVRRFSASRASVMTLLRQVGCGPGQSTPKYWSWCPGLWGALWGSLWNFSSAPRPLPPQPRRILNNLDEWCTTFCMKSTLLI